MKKYFILILFFLNNFFSVFVVAQIHHKPIRISPEIGDTIDLAERNYYNLFPEFKDFKCAVFYISADSTSAISRITYISERGMQTDTLINYLVDYIGNLKSSIRQINIERFDNYDSIDKITITRLDGNKYEGKLLAVQDSSFLVCPNTISNVGTLNFIKTYVKLNSQEVESVLLEFGYWSEAGVAASYGGILGLVIGGYIGGNQPVGPNQIYGDLSKMSNTVGGALLGMLAGASVGFVVGLLIATPDEKIEISSANDIAKLKKYLVY